MEEVEIEINGKKDRILEVTELKDSIKFIYEKAGQEWEVYVPRKALEYVGKIIEDMEIGERYSSVYLYNRFLKEQKVKSEMMKKRMSILKDVLRLNGVLESKIESILYNLDQSDDFSLMTYEEMIGDRRTETSVYFQVYFSIRYYVLVNKIQYTRRGGIYRVI